MSRSGASRPSFLRTRLIWTAGFLAFPLAGLAGTGVAGRVDTPVAALLGVTATPLDQAVADTLDAYRPTHPPTSTTKPARQRS